MAELITLAECLRVMGFFFSKETKTVANSLLEERKKERKSSKQYRFLDKLRQKPKKVISIALQGISLRLLTKGIFMLLLSKIKIFVVN